MIWYRAENTERVIIEDPSNGQTFWFYHCGKTNKDLYQGVGGVCLTVEETLFMYNTTWYGDSLFKNKEEFDKKRESLPLWVKTKFVKDIDE